MAVGRWASHSAAPQRRHPPSRDRTAVLVQSDRVPQRVEPEVREYLVEEYGADGLPFNTRYGNGDPIGADIVQVINDVYEANIAREPLQAGDLMLIDNIRTAHSREPFEGEREVLVAMSDPVRVSDCSPTVGIGC